MWVITAVMEPATSTLDLQVGQTKKHRYRAEILDAIPLNMYCIYIYSVDVYVHI